MSAQDDIVRDIRADAAEVARLQARLAEKLRQSGRTADAVAVERQHDRWVQWALGAIERAEAGAPVVSLARERLRRSQGQGGGTAG